MREITVNASSRYAIRCGSNLLDDTGRVLSSVSGAKRAVIVTDDVVAPLYAQTVKEALTASGIGTEVFILPNGERSKSLRALGELYDFCCEKKITRSDAVVALGGGVVGDLAGFCAATYMRGVDLIQIPTTFLAQIDSSIGGKTAVNLPGGKNLVGAFKQPKAVLCDVSTLRTLSPAHFADGTAEAIKYGMIKDPWIFEVIENGRLEETLLDVICRCIEIKRQVVEADEFDNGERRLLNFGHTFGHAIEKFTDYTGYSHGMAVAAGMVMITALSERYGLTSPGTAERLKSCVASCGLPVGADIDDKTLIRYSLMDKKASADSVSIVLASEVGKSFVKKLSRDEYISFVKGSFRQ